MVGIRWSVWGDDIIARDLLRFSEHAVDPVPAFVAIAEDIRDALEMQFDSEGGHASGGWAPLAASTVANKAAAGLDPRILHATLALRNSLTDASAEGAHFEATPDGFTFGSDIEYGQYHQTGTGIMPQRRPLEFTELEKRGFMKTLQRWIVEGDVGAGGLT